MDSAKYIWPVLRWVLLIAVVYALSIRLFEPGAIYFPERYPTGDWEPRQAGLNIEDCYFPAAAGVLLHAWYIPPPAPILSGPAPILSGQGDFTLLYLHGNAGNLTHRIEALSRLHQLPASILILDYRGYGRSQGSPSEQGLYLDADAAYHYLVEAKHVPPERLVVLGESLGSAVAVDLAARRPVAGLILEAPFSSARDVARRVIPLPFAGFLIRSRFDSASKIGSVRVPLLIAHGERDSVVPIDLGRKLFAAAREPKFFYALPQAEHNDIPFEGGEAYLDRLREFLGVVRSHAGPVVSGRGS